jgi:hypothetical protein
MRWLRLPLLFLVLPICLAFAEPPQTISYQGVLKDEEGNPIGDNDYSLTCRLYDVPSGGEPLWTETQTIETLDGVFSVTLGAVSTLNLPFDTAYWLGISLEGGAEMTPRIALASSPYAFRAAVADALEGGVPGGTERTIRGLQTFAGRD